MKGTQNPDWSDSPEFIGDRALIFIGIFAGAQIIAVALRFYARALTVRKYGLDDWLVVASLLSMIATAVVSISGIKQGVVGYHTGYLEKTNPEAIPLFFKYLLVLSIWFYATCSLSRLAICVLYRHLFTQRITRILNNIIIGMLISMPIATVTIALVACTPFSASWAPLEVQSTKCLNREALFLWCTFPNILIDAVLLVFPIPIIWRLATTIQLKMALTFTFLIGSVGLVATILRFVAFFEKHSLGDPTFVAVELMVWTMAEPGIGLISACIIMYRPILKKMGSCCSRDRNVRTASWPVSYGSRSLSRNHMLRHRLEDGDRGIALRNERSIEQILARSHSRNRSDHGRIDGPENDWLF